MGSDFAGKRYTVLGLGILGGGVGVARYLARNGATVTVTDMRPAEQLQSSIDQLQGLPITYHLGGHEDADFTRERTDIVIRNPGVRRWSPYLKLAREHGVAIEMEMSLFFARCQAPILGITGTKGKTTVSTLCGEIMRAWKPDAILAGNMGVSALDLVDEIRPGQPVVIELSSWQLEALDEHRMGPHVAVLTNISPDHLDAYDGFEDYAATKRTIGHHLSPQDYVVFNANDDEARCIANETSGTLLPFGLTETVGDGGWITASALNFRVGGEQNSIPLPAQLALSGEQGRLNALAAGLACLAYGAPFAAVSSAIEAFRGVPNRLEEVATVNDVLYVNDTSATAPAAAVHAIQVLSERSKRVRIIAGGSDKQTDLSPFADAMAAHDVDVYLLNGNATPTLQRLAEERGVTPHGPFDSMPSAFAAAYAEVQPGDALALIPGCASFGMFRNEFDRGDQFRAEVARIQENQE